jgi:hypothetical protein
LVSVCKTFIKQNITKYKLSYKQQRNKQSFNKAIKKAAIELVKDLTNIKSKFNSSNKVKC